MKHHVSITMKDDHTDNPNSTLIWGEQEFTSKVAPKEVEEDKQASDIPESTFKDGMGLGLQFRNRCITVTEKPYKVCRFAPRYRADDYLLYSLTDPEMHEIFFGFEVTKLFGILDHGVTCELRMSMEKSEHTPHSWEFFVDESDTSGKWKQRAGSDGNTASACSDHVKVLAHRLFNLDYEEAIAMQNRVNEGEPFTFYYSFINLNGATGEELI
jgi:hypothetical protein